VGGFYNNSNHSLSFSLGETAIQTYGNSNYILTEGFLQSDDFLLGFDEQLGSQFNVYPNPVLTELYIKSPRQLENIEISNTLGQTIFSSKLEVPFNRVNLSILSEGIYFGKIYDTKNQLMYTVKFLKQ